MISSPKFVYTGSISRMLFGVSVPANNTEDHPKKDEVCDRSEVRAV